MVVWRESKIFLENETLYPSDTVIKFMLCTAINFVFWDTVNIKCTKILKADTISSHGKCNYFYAILISSKRDRTTNSTGIRATWINTLLYKVLLNLHIFPVLNENGTEPYLGPLHGSYKYLLYTKTVDSVFRALWLATQSVNVLRFRAEKRNELAWTFLPRSPGRV